MKSANLLNAALLGVAVIVSGCVSTGGSAGGGCGMFYQKGELKIVKDRLIPATGECPIEITFTNTDEGQEKPVVKATFFDVAGNTLDEKSFYFARIESGKNQTVSNYVKCRGQAMQKVTIVSAYDSGACTGRTCLNICGVAGRSYIFTQPGRSEAVRVDSNP